MVAGVEVGLALFLAGVLAAAGVAKLLNVELTRATLGRLVGPGRPAVRRLLGPASVLLGTGEALLAAALALAPTRPVPACAAALLCLGFVVAVRRARRLGTACGCFGSLSLRVSGPVELARALALLGIGVLLLALTVVVPPEAVAPPGAVYAPGVAAGVLGAALATVVPIALAGRARTPGRIGALLLPRPTGWRAAGFPVRQRILRTARSLDPVRDVERERGRPVPGRRAWVRITGRPYTAASVVVVHDDLRMQVTLPRQGEPTVLGHTRHGNVTPAIARATHERSR
jgi:hypothetical protein